MSEEFAFQRLNTKDNGLVDVIFVHGLRGDSFETWSSPKSVEPEGGFWPEWLDSDVPGLSVHMLSYPAPWFLQWAKQQMNLYERAKQVLDSMAAYGIGERPIVFISHSLGGLVVKQLIRTALESTDDAWKQIAQRCRAIFFIATPHQGSALANILAAFAAGLESKYIEALSTNNEELTQLNESCRSACGANEIAVYSYYEMYETLPVGLVVSRASADPGIGTNMTVPVSANHIEISRPIGRHSPLYLGVSRRVREVVESVADSLGNGSTSFAIPSEIDRRDLHQKLVAAGREHEFPKANESQNRFARQYTRSGLIAEVRAKNDALLAEIEERFNVYVYNQTIAAGASNGTIDEAVRTDVIEPVAGKYASETVTARTVRDGINFLTEKCHIRWDPP